MKILWSYIKPYKLLVTLVLVLAALNIGFSMIDPIIFGKLVNLSNAFIQSRHDNHPFSSQRFYWSFSWMAPGVVYLLLCSIGVAMISRIAKNFQDYFLSVITQKFGAKVFTDGLQRAMQLPYQEFEDQRSGETLSVLQKVRTDTERFMSNFVNILFTVFVGIVIVPIFHANISPWLTVIFL